MRTARILKNFRHLSKTTLFQIIYMLFCTFTLTHWAGCGFYFLARWQVSTLPAKYTLHCGIMGHPSLLAPMFTILWVTVRHGHKTTVIMKTQFVTALYVLSIASGQDIMSSPCCKCACCKCIPVPADKVRWS